MPMCIEILTIKLQVITLIEMPEASNTSTLGQGFRLSLGIASRDVKFASPLSTQIQYRHDRTDDHCTENNNIISKPSPNSCPASATC